MRIHEPFKIRYRAKNFRYVYVHPAFCLGTKKEPRGNQEGTGGTRENHFRAVVAPSTIEGAGMGLFTGEFIQKGSHIGEYGTYGQLF